MMIRINGMRSTRVRNMLALVVSLAVQSAFAETPGKVEAPTTAPDVAVDAEGAWTHFLAHAETKPVYEAYGVANALVDANGVIAAQCEPNRDALTKAIKTVPVSVYLHHLAMQCAEATGDDDAAERELRAVASLAKLAFANTSESRNATPIRVVHYLDALALMRSAGLEARYARYAHRFVERDYPMVVAAWDPERKAERHLRFDWIETAQRLSRAPNEQYPTYLQSTVANGLQADMKYNFVPAVDMAASRESYVVDGYEAKVAKLRMAAEAGGAAAPGYWIVLCSEADAPNHCADGLVDALLVQSEKQHALPMTLLAYAYANGLGVEKDEAAGVRLLDAADKLWSREGASVAYADLWQNANADAPMPEWLARRVAHAASVGNEDATFVQVYDHVRRDEKLPFTMEQVAYLESRAQNGQGRGLGMLASNAGARGDTEAQTRYTRRAADAGDAFSQAQVASSYLTGEGVEVDEAAGKRWLALAARSGNTWAARRLGYFEWNEGNPVAAQNWFLGAVAAYDLHAFIALANLYSTDHPALQGNSKKAVELYRSAATAFPEARRNLASMLIEGKGTDKNLAEARRLLLQDAETGDAESQGQLGMMLLMGKLGRVDETNGRKWVEKALATGNTSLAASYGYWLVYTKNTPESRKQGLAVWRKAMETEKEDSSVNNNYAWALCTAPMDDVRDGKAGLEVARTIRAGQDWGVIDTVAACHAADGDFAKAQALQRDVVARYRKYVEGTAAARNGAKADAGQAEAEAKQLKELEDRLALYASGKPYLEDLSKQ